MATPEDQLRPSDDPALSDNRPSAMVVRRGGKRTRGERERDLVVMTRLWLQGFTMAGIAARLTANRSYEVTPANVSTDLKKVRDEWRGKVGRAAEDMRAEEVAKLDMIEQEALAAWERSKRPATVDTEKRVVAGRGGKGKGNGKGNQTTTHKVEGRDGDPRFLDLAKDCIVKRARLLGLGDVEPVDDGRKKRVTNVTLVIDSPRSMAALPRGEEQVIDVTPIRDET